MQRPSAQTSILGRPKCRDTVTGKGTILFVEDDEIVAIETTDYDVPWNQWLAGSGLKQFTTRT